VTVLFQPSDIRRSRITLQPTDGRMDAAFPFLSVHMRADQLSLAAPICADETLGAVVCVSPKMGSGQLGNLVETFASYGADVRGLMLDPARYAGKKRAIGTDEMSTAWVRTQTNAGIAHPLTNSGYIPEGRDDILRQVLRATRGMGEQVVAALPLAGRFLDKDVSVLIDEINHAGNPVGIMVEHAKDPFGKRANVAGLTRVLTEVEVPVLLLRSDLSVVGALAWGARGGAFGTSTTLRHIFPMPKKGGGRPWAPSTSALVKDTMSLTRLDKIADAIQRMPDPTIWDCQCTICFGKSIEWIATENDAFQHNLSVVAVLAAEVLDQRLSWPERRLLWQRMCHTAQVRAYELDSETAGAWGDPPNFLGAWVARPVDATPRPTTPVNK
jgi:hypothetical protein